MSERIVIDEHQSSIEIEMASDWLAKYPEANPVTRPPPGRPIQLAIEDKLWQEGAGVWVTVDHALKLVEALTRAIGQAASAAAAASTVE